MGVRVYWDNAEQTTIVGEIDWPYTWDDLSAAWQMIVDMMSTVPKTVHVIVVGKSSQFPPGNPLTNLKRVVAYEPENLGLTILVTENHFHAIINTMLFKLSPRLNKNGRVVHSLEAAHAAIDRETGIPGTTV